MTPQFTIGILVGCILVGLAVVEMYKALFGDE